MSSRSGRRRPTEASTSAIPSIFNSLVPFSDRNNKSHLATLTNHLEVGSPSAILNDHLKAQVLASTQRTADWAAQRRKAGKETGLSDVQRGKRRRIEEGWAGENYEPVEVPDVEKPHEFPSNNLLSSLHSHAATRFASQGLLQPPLTPTNPYLPPSSLEKIESVKAALDAQEEADARRTAGRGWRDVKANWYKTKDRGERKSAWRDVERKLEPSAMVALGILVELLAADSLSDPSTTTNNINASAPISNNASADAGGPTALTAADKLALQRAKRAEQNRRSREKARMRAQEEKEQKERNKRLRIQRQRISRGIASEDEGNLTTWASEGGSEAASTVELSEVEEEMEGGQSEEDRSGTGTLIGESMDEGGEGA
ncbi:hypothetical protein P7C70_g2131, partial [Phenoliferia sp. Uapishka_3]